MRAAAAPVLQIVLIGSVSLSACASGSSATLEDALFKDLGDQLSPSQRSELAANLGFRLADDGVTWLDPICQRPMDAPQIWSDDLNADGTPEIAVQAGNACSAGFTGAHLWLFTKADDTYHPILQAIAFGYEPRPERTANFPDLRLGGPGFCHPVWRWNGIEYQYHHREDETPGGCAQKQSTTPQQEHP